MLKDRSKTSPKKAPKNTGDEDQNAVGTQQVTASAIESSTQGNSDVDGSLSSITSKPSHRRQNPPAAGLHIVATPIGNASDITLRALDILAQADMIACEDTRVTRKLLSIHGLDTHRLISYHEHNAESAGPKIMEALNSGKIVAQVSDAGTPMINDPGYRLAQQCRDAGISVHVVPGASAVTAALVLAGLPTDRFMYCGFPPPKSARRRTWLGALRHIDATLVMLESAGRLGSSLTDMNDVFGPRPAAVTREMTKKFEEVRHGTLAELATHYANAGPPKGEITLVIGAPEGDGVPDAADVEARLRVALETESVREASARIAAETGLPKRDIYTQALALKDELGK